MLLANYGDAKLKSETNTSLDDMPRHTASRWSTKTFGLPDEAQLRLGGGVVYSGKSVSTSPVWSIVTPSRTTVDALAEISWNNRSEEHTSELQSLMRISYAVFCLKKKIEANETNNRRTTKLSRLTTTNLKIRSSIHYRSERITV